MKDEAGSEVKGTILGVQTPRVRVQGPNHVPKPERPDPGPLLSFRLRALLRAMLHARVAFGCPR